MRTRLNKKHLVIKTPEDDPFPLGAIDIAQLEAGGVPLKDLGLRAYKNPDGTLTLELALVEDEGKPVSHTLPRKQWYMRRPKGRKKH